MATELGQGIGSTAANIAQLLRSDILDGTLPPGMRIGQEALAERFSASRIPVRESLKLLESEGLVTIVPNSGAWVARLDWFEFDQIYKLREQVESLAIRESLEGLTQAQIASLQVLVEDVANAKDVETFLRLDREFHLQTYAGATFSLLHDLVTRFWNSTQHYRRTWAQSPNSARHWTTDAEHRLIVDSLVRKDAVAASNLVSGHIRRTRLALANRPELFD